MEYFTLIPLAAVAGTGVLIWWRCRKGHAARTGEDKPARGYITTASPYHKDVVIRLSRDAARALEEAALSDNVTVSEWVEPLLERELEKAESTQKAIMPSLIEKTRQRYVEAMERGTVTQDELALTMLMAQLLYCDYSQREESAFLPQERIVLSRAARAKGNRMVEKEDGHYFLTPYGRRSLLVTLYENARTDSEVLLFLICLKRGIIQMERRDA